MINTLWNFSEFLATATIAAFMLFVFVRFVIAIIAGIVQGFKDEFKH